MATKSKKSVKKSAPAKKPTRASGAKSRPAAKPAKKAAPVKAKAKAPAKPAAKAVAKPAAKPAPRVIGKPAVKGSAAPRVVGKPAVKGTPAPRVIGKPAVKGTPGKAAPALTASQRLVGRLVPSKPGATRPAPAAKPAAGGKTRISTRPPAPVIPLGVLPPESQQRPAKQAPAVRAVLERRPEPTPRAKEPVAEGKLTKKELEHFERRLQTEHTRLMGEMGHLESNVLKVNPRDASNESSGYSFHMADAGTDSMEREISFDIASKEGRLLVEVRDALKRIYAGTFGICEASGQMINRARLEALPWARYTLAEQEKLERKQRTGAKVAAEAE